MTKRFNNIVIQITVWFLVIALIITFAPIRANAASESKLINIGESSSGQEIFNAFTNLGDPDGFDAKQAENPYSYKDNPAALLRNSGLMFGGSAYRSEKDISKEVILCKGYNKGKEPIGGGSYKTDAWEDPYKCENADFMADYYYIQAVPLDPDGDGLRNVIAYIGYDRMNTKEVKIWTLNTDEDKHSAFENNVTTVGKAVWLGNLAMNAEKFLSITAGDYDADGKDTIAVYACLDDEDYGLFEYSYNNGNLELKEKDESKALLNTAYNKYSECHTSQNYYNRLEAYLTSGDLDNDGIDDLVVTSDASSNNYGYDYGDKSGLAKKAPAETREAFLAVSLGQENMENSPVSKCDTSAYVTNTDSSGNSSSLTSAGLDIGQVGTDGYNKLTVCGYRTVKDTSKVPTGLYCVYLNSSDPTKPAWQGASYTESYFYEIRDGEIKKYKPDTLLYKTEFQAAQQGPYNYDVPRANVVSAYADGYGRQEHVFLNGRIYKLESDGSFKQEMGFLNAYELLSFYNVTAASLTANPYGAEQFVAAYSGGNPNTSHADIVPCCAIISGNTDFKEDGSITPCSGYSCSTGYFYSSTGSQNGIVAPFENKQSDIVCVRLNQKGYYYSNPEPKAVLQAAPYFKGLSNAGSTTYGITSEYTKAEEKSTNSSVGVSFSESFGYGIFKETYSLTYTEAISEGFGKSETESYTTSFSTESKDTVVLETTPVTYYSYDVYDPENNKWKKDDMAVTVAGQPVYAQITVDQYNSFAEYYDKYLDEHQVHYEDKEGEKTVEVLKLNTIDKGTYFLGDEGNPDSYSHDWNRLPKGQNASKGMIIGYHGGYNTCNYGEETLTTKVNTKTNTISHSFSLTLGGDIMPDLGGWVTGSLTSSKGTTLSTSVTTGDGYSITGYVRNIDLDDLTESGKFSEAAVKSYGFQWSFGLSEFSAHDNSKMPEGQDSNITVVCYVVDKIKRGVQPPELLKPALTNNREILLKWKAPQLKEGESIDGYNVYAADIDGDFYKLTNSPLSSTTTEYAFTPPEYNEQYSFVVTSIGKTGSQKTNTEGIPSNVRSILYTPEQYGKETITVGVADKHLTYGDSLSLSENDLIFPEGTDKSGINMDNLSWVTTYKEGGSAGNYTVKARGLSSDAYTFAYEEGMIDVSEKKLTNADLEAAASDKVYDGSAEASGSLTIKSGLCNGDKISVYYSSADFEDAEPGTDKLVTFRDPELSGARAHNYILDVKDNLTAKASILKKPVEVWANAGTSHKYNAAPKQISVYSNPERETVVSYYKIEEDGIIGEKVEKPEDPGRYMYVIALTDSDRNRYEIPNALSEKESDFSGKKYEELEAGNIGIMEIVREEQKPLEFEDPLVEKTYGDETFAQIPSNIPEGASVRYEVVDGRDRVSVNAETGEVEILKPGTALLKATAYIKDYDITSAYYAVDVSKKKVSIELSDDTELTYNGQNREMPFEIKGDVEGNRIKREDIIFSYTDSADPKKHSTKDAGQYNVTARIPADNEYYYTDGESTGVMTVISKPLEIRPDSGQSKKYGQYDPNFAYEAVGLEEGDVLSGSLGRKEGSAAGEYAFTRGTLDARNYDLFIQEDAPKFTIEAAPVYYVPESRITVKKNKVKVKWQKIADADGYMIYAARCGKKFSKPCARVSARTNACEISKISGRKIKDLKGKGVKFLVAAYKMKGGKKIIIAKSLILRSTIKSKKYTDARSVKIKSNTTIRLAAGDSSEIKAATIKNAASKKLLPKDHVRQYRYRTSADYIAAVDKRGVITATGSGVCNIRVYAQNGKSAKVKVVVEQEKD